MSYFFIYHIQEQVKKNYFIDTSELFIGDGNGNAVAIQTIIQIM